MARVCFDTNIMIWGILGQSRPGQEDRIERAKYLIEDCQSQGDKLIVPSLVISEMSVGLSPPDRIKFLNIIRKNFIVQSFDTKAALEFAQLFGDKNTYKEMYDKSVTRAVLKIDLMIVATAKSANVQCLYSNDEDLRKVAKQFMLVRDLPNLPPEQLEFRLNSQ